jgi:RNA polymerase sigma factor (TIGR02999 family)
LRGGSPGADFFCEEAIMAKGSGSEVTQLLRAWSAGGQDSAEKLIPLVYDQLRRMAAHHLRGERAHHTLQPTALVHEAYLRLVGQENLEWESRSHFFAIAAKTMRRILIEHARKQQYAKRGGGERPVSLEDAGELTTERSAELVALDDALEGLATVDPGKAAIVELRFFGGLSLTETAEVVGCSRATVARQWQIAKGWLYRECMGDREGDP